MNRHAIEERIVSDPTVLLGKPIIRSTRVSVELIVGLIGAGHSPVQIAGDYPELSVEDVEAAVAFAVAEVGRTEAPAR